VVFHNSLFRVPHQLHIYPEWQCNFSVKVTGSSRLSIMIPHLHGKFNFTGISTETAKRWLRHSCRSEITWQGVSLHYYRYCYNSHSQDIRNIAKQYSFSFLHWAGVRHYTLSYYDFAMSCVFIKQFPLHYSCFFVIKTKMLLYRRYKQSLPSSLALIIPSLLISTSVGLSTVSYCLVFF